MAILSCMVKGRWPKKIIVETLSQWNDLPGGEMRSK